MHRRHWAIAAFVALWQLPGLGAEPRQVIVMDERRVARIGKDITTRWGLVLNLDVFDYQFPQGAGVVDIDKLEVRVRKGGKAIKITEVLPEIVNYRTVPCVMKVGADGRVQIGPLAP